MSRATSPASKPKVLSQARDCQRTTTDRADERRRTIIAATVQMLADGRLQAATTLDIASAAGVSKRDLYAAFPSKAALIGAMVAARVDQFPELSLMAAGASRAAAYASLLEFSERFLTFLVGPGAIPLYRLAIAHGGEPISENAPSLGHMLLVHGIARTSAKVRLFFEQAMAEGSFAFDSLDAAVGAYFGCLINNLQMRALLDPATPITDGDIARHIALTMGVLRAIERRQHQT